jgi:outer membrane protein OmpA-like peptidoglycan-associated protein
MSKKSTSQRINPAPSRSSAQRHADPQASQNNPAPETNLLSKLSVDSIFAMQRTMGNQAVQRRIRRAQGQPDAVTNLQRHWIEGEAQDEEMKNRVMARHDPNLQRHWIEGEAQDEEMKSRVMARHDPRLQRHVAPRSSFEAPSPHFQLQRQTAQTTIQRNWLADQFAQLRSFFGSMFGDDKKEVVDQQNGTKLDNTQQNGTKLDNSQENGKQTPDAPKLTASDVQLGAITLSSSDPLIADGSSTVTAQVATTPANRPVTWSFIGPAYGSTIDANGVITAGSDLGKKDDVGLMIQANDAEFSSVKKIAAVTLVTADYAQGIKDYTTLITGSPYTKAGFTAGLNGHFDMIYNPVANTATSEIRVKFAFTDDAPKAGESDKAKQERDDRQKTYRETYANMIESGWSKKYPFVNVREPQSIWGKLNPTNVIVDVKEDDKNPHFTINVAAANQGGAYVQGPNAYMGKKLDPQAAFNVGDETKNAELKRVQNLTPELLFANNSADVPADKLDKLAFLATYLSRINNPKFKLSITGHASNTGAAAQNQTLSEDRANNVRDLLIGGGAANHTIEAKGVGSTGAGKEDSWRKVAIAVTTVDGGWQNIQDVTLHEFGHMIGLGDEYVGGSRKVGDATTHYGLVKKALGQDYADEVAKVGDASASVMEGGNDVRIQHYVTFWDALVTASGQAAAPTKKFTHDDWKFSG